MPSFEQGFGPGSVMRRSSDESAAEYGDGGEYMMSGALDEGTIRQPGMYQAPMVDEEEGVDMGPYW